MTHGAPGVATRLKRLPGQLLLALINATALLVIVACILVIVVVNRADHAAESIAGTVTDATLSRIDMSPAEVRSNLQSINDRVSGLSAKLDAAGSVDKPDLVREIKSLNRNLNEMKLLAKGLGTASPEVADAAFRQAGAQLTDTLLALRGCSLEKGTEGQGS